MGSIVEGYDMEIDRMIDDGCPNTEPSPSNRDRMLKMLEDLKAGRRKTIKEMVDEIPGEEVIDAGVYRFAWVPMPGIAIKGGL